MLSRNPISDLEAIAAMPGLEEVAQAIVDHDPATRKRAGDPLALSVRLGARCAFGSDGALDSALRFTPLWEMARRSAARVGRTLPQAPPTADQWRHYTKRATDGYATALAASILQPTLDQIARPAGMLRPESSSGWETPDQVNAIAGDGSVFRALSDVAINREGEWVGTRARSNPRIASTYGGKPDSRAYGVPIAAVAAHGGRRHQRVLLAVGLYRDADEIGASMRLFEKVMAAAGDGVRAVHYDGLMSGIHRRAILKQGAVPVVAMGQAPDGTKGVLLPSPKVKGSGSKAKVKTRAKIFTVDVVAHGPYDTCVHEIWGLDGDLVTVQPGREVSFDSPRLRRVSVDRIEGPDGYAFVGTYSVPCPHGEFTWQFDLAGDRRGKNRKGINNAIAEYVSLIPERDPEFDRIKGRRSDIESVFATLKHQLPYSRATKLCPERFFADVVGGALWINATCWDVHVAQHTACGQALATSASKASPAGAR